MQKKGYTLIEIMVVISIIALLMQGGFASYRQFSRRQLIVNVKRQVEGDLRLAQQQSLANTRPDGFVCAPPDTFSGIEFSASTQTSYIISAVCSDGSLHPIKAVELPPNAVFIRSGDPNVVFLPLGDGTDASGEWQIGICTYGVDSTSLIVSESGEIAERDFDGCSEVGGFIPPGWCHSPVWRPIVCALYWLFGSPCPCD